MVVSPTRSNSYLSVRYIPCGAHSAPLWPHSSAIVLNGKNVAIESGGPLSAFPSHLQIAQGVAHIPPHFSPKKPRIALLPIGRGPHAQPFFFPPFAQISSTPAFSPPLHTDP